MKRYRWIAIIMICFLLMVGCGTNNSSTNQTEDNNEEVSAEVNHNEKNSNETSHENNINETNENSTNADNKANNDNNEESQQNEDKKNTDKSLDDLTVHYIDVGQADATLFQFADENGAYTIFDTGDWQRNDAVNYLASQDVSTIDLVITSHPHSDHIGQLAEIMRTYDVEEVWMSGNTSSSKTYQHAQQAVLDSDASYHEPRTGEEFAIGPMDITVLYPGDITGDLNEESVSLRMNYGDIDFVFTGDAEKGAERRMIQSGMSLQADILQLGHHGSRTSSTPAFIEAVDPEVAIYSAGSDNQYGHPHPEVITRIQDAGIDLFGTDTHGTIIVQTDGNTYDIQTAKDGTISPDSTGSAETGQANTEQSDTETTTDENYQKEDANTGACVDINHASVEDLQNIIHIGPVRAEELIKQRPFKSVDNLTNIKGIGPSRIADIQAENTACVQ